METLTQPRCAARVGHPAGSTGSAFVWNGSASLACRRRCLRSQQSSCGTRKRCVTAAALRAQMAYTALARMAAVAGRPDDAYAAVQELLAAKSLPARLRAFVPALQGYCAAGQVDKAFQARSRNPLQFY